MIGTPRHRAARGLLVGLAVLGMLGCAASRGGELVSRGVREATSTEAALSRALEPRRIALLMGVDQYAHPAMRDLRFAGRDARAMAELLGSEQGGFDRVVVVGDDEEPDRATFLGELQSIAADVRRGDVFLLYFSGHGTLALDEKGLARLYLLPSDADPGAIHASGIELQALRTFFAGLPTEQKVLIVDACFHGEGKSATPPGADPLSEDVLDATVQSSVRSLAAGEAHLFASTLGRPAFEDTDLGHGVYTHYLIQAMSWLRTAADKDSDGLLTAWEAHDFARTRVAEHTEGAQIPEASFRVVGEQDLVLSGTNERREARRHALLYQYGGASGRFSGYTLVVDGQAKGVFPGTFPITPGPHHLELRDPAGGRSLDGYTVLTAGQNVAVQNLGVELREDRFMQAVRVGIGSGSPATAVLWGDRFVAVEGWTALRVPRGPGRGLFAGITLGGGVSPTRRDLERLLRKGRGAFWLGMEAGWGIDHRRLRMRAAWQLRGTLVPVARIGDPDAPLQPEEAGWLFASTGPSLHLGVILDRRLSLVGVGTLQLTNLDPDLVGEPRTLVFGTFTMGLELGL